MDRKELDAFVAHHKLSPEAVAAVFEIVGARPDPEETRNFLIQLSRIAGVLSLAAGVVFFVAANWQDFGVAGRFVLVQLVLVGSIALATWRPAPIAVGRYALLMVFIATGALLALFGQTYQSGADVYELFLTWAMVGLPFVLAGQWSVIWAAWLLVLNTSFALFCSTQPGGGLWMAFGGRGWDLTELLLPPTAVNLGLWALSEYLQHTRWHLIASPWLGRLTFASAAAFGTWSAMITIFHDGRSTDVSAFAVAVLCALAIGAAVHVLRRRQDVFPIAMLAASGIVLTTSAIAEFAELKDLGMYFTLALWLILSSTLSGRVLMKLVRDWKYQAAAS